MAFDNTITLVGNVTADPDLVKANSGIMVCNFSVAWNPPPREGQTEDPAPTFVNVVAFRSLAENVAETVNILKKQKYTIEEVPRLGRQRGQPLVLRDLRRRRGSQPPLGQRSGHSQREDRQRAC